jgi:hypothetical protein
MSASCQAEEDHVGQYLRCRSGRHLLDSLFEGEDALRSRSNAQHGAKVP